MSNNEIMKIRVCSRNFVVDIISSVKNFLGMRLNQYENMISKAKEEIFNELKEEGSELSWFRYEISQLTNGAMVVMLYGEKK